MTKDMALPAGRAVVNGAASVSAVPASVPSAVWVIIRSTGEYSDREETAIRFCLSEEDAQKAISLIEVERQRDQKPQLRIEQYAGWKLPDGSWVERGYLDPRAKFASKPDADAIIARNQQRREEYESAVSALNHVDPEGSWTGDSYYYERVTLWPPY